MASGLQGFRASGRKSNLLTPLSKFVLFTFLLALFCVPAWAEKANVKYYAWDDAQKKLVEMGPVMATVVEGSDGDRGWVGPENREDLSWFVVQGENVEIKGRISISGTVNLILADGAKLTVGKGINVGDGQTLNIYGQSEGTGTLVADATNAGTSYYAGIGGNGDAYGGSNAVSGTVNIHGGTVTATGATEGAGIGGGRRDAGGTVNIYGGTVNAKGGSIGAGIGGGGAAGGTVAIYGGTVTATGGAYDTFISMGIGGGAAVTRHGTLTLGDGVSIQVSEDGATWSAYDGSTRKQYMKTGITKDTQTITASDVTATYGDTDKSVSATTNGDGAISYAVKDGSGDYISVASNGKLTIMKVPTSGTAYVTVTAAETDTYAAASKDVTVTIKAKSVTITAKDQSIYVGGTVPTLSGADFYTVAGLLGEDALTTAPTLAYQKNGSAATPDNSTAGTYDIVPSGASAGDNYAISYTNGTLTISEQPAMVTTAPTSKDLTYTGSERELVTAGTPNGGTMKYAFTSGDQTAQPSNWDTSIPKGTDAGIYHVWYMVSGDANHTNTAPAGPLNVVIAKAKVTVTAKPQTVKQNGSIETGTDQAELLGALTGHSLAAVTLTADTSKVTDSGSIIPSAASIKSSVGDVTANYDISYVNGKLTVKAASDAPTPGTDGDTLVVGDVESKDVSSLNDYLDQYKDQPEQLAKIEKLYFDDAKTLTDLNGVEKLTNVKQVTVIKCPALQSADLSGLTKLEEVAMNNCESLKELDVSNCPELTSLDCSASEIELLKMDGCPKLAFVDCSLNSLGYLDMSKDDFPKLVSLDCHGQTKDGLDPVQSGDRWVTHLAAFTTPQPELEAGNVKLASVNNVIPESVQGYKRVGLDDVKIETTCSSTGIVSFASRPEWMVYNYNTGFENVSMDVTVMGTEKTAGGSSSSSSGCGNDPWWVLLLAPLPFLF